jgi:hypothetical protein
MCMGEKYRVCPVTEPDGGTTDCEIHLGDVGAYVESPVGVTDVTVDSSPC